MSFCLAVFKDANRANRSGPIVSHKAGIGKTIFCIGSHDMTLDLLAQFLAKKDRRFVSSNVGSQRGLISLQLREAHLAGSHLFDPDTGDFNISYIRQYIPDRSVRLVAFVHREQGLMVPRR